MEAHMPWEPEKYFTEPVDPKPAEEPDELKIDRERRHEARRFFRAAPPYCIEFDTDGTAMLCQKHYEYWPDRTPEEATTWRTISRHESLEEAERRLRIICSVPVFYDQQGRMVTHQQKKKPRWEMPPTDEE
jgi:hypothetical protein